MKTRLLLTVLLAVCFAVPAHAQLNDPNGLAFDSAGNLWVANEGANNVLELNPTTGAVLNTITSGISGPTRLAFDGAGNLYVTNFTTGTITVYNKSLALTRTISGLSHPLGVAVDAYGDIYAANNLSNDIVAYNAAGDLVETLTQDKSGVPFTAPGALAISGADIYAAVIGGDVISYNIGNFLTDFPIEITKYTDSVSTGPTGILVRGDIYVSYRFSNDVVKYGPAGKAVLTITVGMSLPEGIALDKSGNIYVSNAGTPSITVYSSAGVLLRTLDGGAITPTTINFDTTPSGAAIASGTSVVNTYSSDGVTFQFVPCSLGSPLCLGGSGVFAVAGGSMFTFSAPNVVSTISNTPTLEQQWGTVRANFSSVQSSVSIEVLQTCIGQDGACLGSVPASEAAFLSAFNSSGTLLQRAEADPTNTASYQKLTVSDSNIAYVEFSVPYDAINSGANQLAGDFDNLTF
jgi:hypothetical protein